MLKKEERKVTQLCYSSQGVYVISNAGCRSDGLIKWVRWLCFPETNCRINYDPQRNTDKELEELIISAIEDTINILWMI